MHVYTCRSTCICMYAWYLCTVCMYVCTCTCTVCMHVCIHVQDCNNLVLLIKNVWSHPQCILKTAKLFPPIPRQNLTTDANLKEVSQMCQHPQLDIVKVLHGILVERGHQLGNGLVSAKDTGQFVEGVGQHTTYLPLEMRRK